MKTDMKDQTQGIRLADMDPDAISDLGVRATEELKRAQTVREQIYAGA